MSTTIIVVNRSRTSTQRVDRVDYIWVSVREWEGRIHSDISFYTGRTQTDLNRYGPNNEGPRYWKEIKIVEPKSFKGAVKIIRSLMNLDQKNLKKRIRYNRTAIQTMMKRLDLQERIFETLVS
jgi:hypothetical protein